mmetsp:Transcript_24336/g.75129  ORF Transcript_24336/g.75129 Transcript_24336/m.75129 type:complete len:252 (+) Transcript_24336:217-972(+)
MRVRQSGVESVDAPVGDAPRFHEALVDERLHRAADLADVSAGLVAVQDVDVDRGAEHVDRNFQFASQRLGRQVRAPKSRPVAAAALGDDGRGAPSLLRLYGVVLALFGGAPEPLPQNAFALAAAVDPRRVEGPNAQRPRVVQERQRSLRFVQPQRPENQTRHRLLLPRHRQRRRRSAQHRRHLQRRRQPQQQRIPQQHSPLFLLPLCRTATTPVVGKPLFVNEHSERGLSHSRELPGSVPTTDAVVFRRFG